MGQYIPMSPYQTSIACQLNNSCKYMMHISIGCFHKPADLGTTPRAQGIVRSVSILLDQLQNNNTNCITGELYGLILCASELCGLIFCAHGFIKYAFNNLVMISFNERIISVVFQSPVCEQLALQLSEVSISATSGAKTDSDNNDAMQQSKKTYSLELKIPYITVDYTK